VAKRSSEIGWWIDELESARPELLRRLSRHPLAKGSYAPEDALQDTLVEIEERIAAARSSYPGKPSAWLVEMLASKTPSRADRQQLLHWVWIVCERRLVDAYRRRWRESLRIDAHQIDVASPDSAIAEATIILARLSDMIDSLRVDDRELLLRAASHEGLRGAALLPKDRVKLHRLRVALKRKLSSK
jgi:DNA-directed RNA polymerase specialized sigma24 family protein